MNLFRPYIAEHTSDFAVVFKPPKMHSTGNEPGTLVSWFIANTEADVSLPDNGLMHRLDYETHGLVLFAKNKKSYEYFKDMQEKGKFIKMYSAVCCSGSNIAKDGFPPPPELDFGSVPKIIMSYFRPYGPGSKQVRPITEENKFHKIAKDNGSFYRTEIISVQKNEQHNIFTVCIKRGFRHQIRCHLSWIGYPILNDFLYGNTETSFLALRAHGLLFSDPSTGKKIECRIEPLENLDFKV